MKDLSPLTSRNLAFTLGMLVLCCGAAAAQTTLTFQQGVAGYSGGRDTAVRSLEPNTSGGQLQEIGWNADPQTLQTYELVEGNGSNIADTVISQAFPQTSAGSETYFGWDTNVFGSPYPAYTLFYVDMVRTQGNAWQVPPGAHVVSAELTYQCYNTGGAADVLELRGGFSESTTFNGFAFNLEPGPTAVASGSAQGSCDLTASVQRMVNGGFNLGWIMIPRSDSGVEAYSSEVSDPSLRPRLTVQTLEDDIAHSLVRFEDLIGSGASQIPPGSTILSAVLSYETTNTGEAAELRPMLSPWNESLYWSNFQGLSYGGSIAIAPGGSGRQSVDVTSSVQSYANGSPNHGWVFFGVGSDGVEFHSNESSVPGSRPRLEVSFTEPCSGAITNYCSTSPNFWGPGARITAAGSTDVLDNDLTLTVTGANPSGFGLFFYGQGQAATPSGNGTICIGSGLFRLPVTQSSPSGVVTLPLDLTTLPVPVVNGETWNFQYWLRDLTGAGFNFSDAVSITFCE